MAAACRSASLIASARLQSILRLPLPVLFMVASSFLWFRQSGRDDPDPRAALCVDDGKEVVLDHAEQDMPILAVISSPVLTYHGERVIEGQASCLEAYAVIGQILGGLEVIPFEIIVSHDITGYPYNATKSVGSRMVVCISTVCFPRARFFGPTKNVRYHRRRY
jgi:hypothetical protein